VSSNSSNPKPHLWFRKFGVNYLLYLLSLKFVFKLQISETVFKQNIPVISYILGAFIP